MSGGKKSKVPVSEECPWLLNQWDGTKNKITLNEVSRGSTVTIWWICEVGHSWHAPVYSRVNGNGCPYCYGRLVLEEDSIFNTHKKLMVEWDYSLNSRNPKTIGKGSSYKAFWLCPKGHSWKANVNSRANGTGCPFCKNVRASSTNNLAIVRPDIALQWDYSKNEGTIPEDVLPKSNKKYWWVCSSSHSWKTSCLHRSSGTGCPYCSNRKVSNENSLENRNLELSREFDLLKNHPLKPSSIIAGSAKKVWWVCENKHQYQAVVYHRVRGSGCPYCSGRIPSKENNLKDLRPDLASEWDYDLNGYVGPDCVTLKSNKSIYWKCALNHVWLAAVSDRVRGRGCPGCSNRTVYLDNSLTVTHPHLAIEFDLKANSPITPENITAGTNKKIHWVCEFGHKWVAAGCDRVIGNDCPKCVLKGTSKKEIAIYAELETILERKISDNTINVIGTSRKIQIDMLLDDIIIEYDGYYWHNGKETKDADKNHKFQESGYKVVRIREKPLRKLSSIDIEVDQKESIKSIVTKLITTLSSLTDLITKDMVSNYNSSPDLIGKELYFEIIKGNLNKKKRNKK